MKLLLMLIFSTSLVYASDTRHGEIDFDEYYGPQNPDLSRDQYKHQIIFKDESVSKAYINSLLQLELFDLQKYFEGELNIGLSCPDQEYIESYDYLLYLNRLSVISYLFEAFQEYKYTAKEFSAPAGICQVEWGELFKQCQPYSKEMKTFLKNTKHITKNLDPVFVPLEASKKSALEKWISKLKVGRSLNLSQRRIRFYCAENDCDDFSQKSIVKVLKVICEQDEQLIRTVCSERDKLYGVSYIPEIYPLLLRSNALRAFDDQDMAAGCLRRFIDSGKRFEWKRDELKSIFSYLFSLSLRNESEFERGRLFPIGALKEFQEKGLENIFKEFRQEKSEILKVAIKNKALKPIEFKKIELPKWKKKKKKKKKVTKKKPVKKKIVAKKSSFLIASNFRRNYSLLNVSVDMNKFKFDYVFTLEQQEKYTPLVEKMSSIKSLKKMKKRDKLGSKKAPVPLKFLKYMIDYDLHQNLFNILQIVGDQFYVKNDIDSNIKEYELIELKNDMTTQHQWQIIVLDEY